MSIATLLLGEVLIYLPSIARFRLVYLEDRLARAHLATLPLDRSGAVPVAMEIEDALLSNIDALHVRVIRPEGVVALGRPVPVDRAFDLDESNVLQLVYDALETLAARGIRLIRVRGPAKTEAGAEVELTAPEATLWYAMVEYSWRILALSLVLSLLLAGFMFLALRSMIVRPLQRLTDHLARFRERPEDAAHDLVPSGRRDEIGIVEYEVSNMQREVRAALLQKTRLAALGEAVARVNHDLKNMLASAMLISDRLETVGDARVRELAGRLLRTLERAAKLCTETLEFAKSRPAVPHPERVPLMTVVQDAANVFGDGITCETSIDGQLMVLGDRDQLYRVFLNLFRNAELVMGGRGRVSITATSRDSEVVIDVSDSGPGIPEKARERLFEPFAAANARGSGLGLAICREIMRAHGGDIELLATGPEGTTFRLVLPSVAGRWPAYGRSGR